MIVFRQLFDPQSSTYTYLLGDSASGEALLIDPVFEQVRRDAALAHELGLHLTWTLDTHVHADHVTGAWLMKQRAGSRIALSATSGAAGADRLLNNRDRITFGKRYVEVRFTPGHTNGCVTYVLDDQSMAFTGDCLLVRGSGRTDFQQGDPHAMFASVREHIFSLPATCLLYPAHDYRGITATSVEEERRSHPRLGGDIAVDDFAGYRKNLNLPHPKQIDVAVPANLKCGQAAAQNWLDLDSEWGPSSFEQRHQFTLQATYATGQGVGGGTLVPGLRGALLKNWQITANLTTGSGTPRTPTYRVTSVAGITGTVRPDLTGASLDDIPDGFAQQKPCHGRDE